MEGVTYIARDLRELAYAGPIGWGLISGLVLLPLLGFRRWRAGHRLALLPLAVGIGIWTLWFLSYETDWWQFPGLITLMWAVVVLAGGWLLLAAEWGYGRCRRRAHGAGEDQDESRSGSS